jgi:hypothetical protein
MSALVAGRQAAGMAGPRCAKRKTYFHAPRCRFGCTGIVTLSRLQPLMGALRNLGPNLLFGVVGADGDHPPGTVERLDRDFIIRLRRAARAV